MEKTQIQKRLKEVDVGFDFVLPGPGGPEALVLLLDGDEHARRGVAGRSGELVLGFGGGTRWDAGFRGFEEEYDEGEGPYDYGGVRDLV